MLGPSGQSWVSPFPLQGCWLPGFTRFMADFTVDPPRGQSPGLGRAWRGESHREVFVPHSMSRERNKQLRAPRAPSRWF